MNASNIDDLQWSDAYADFIMKNASGDRVICNGDTLLLAMEEGYLFEEFTKWNTMKNAVNVAETIL